MAQKEKDAEADYEPWHDQKCTKSSIKYLDYMQQADKIQVQRNLGSKEDVYLKWILLITEYINLNWSLKKLTLKEGMCGRSNFLKGL